VDLDTTHGVLAKPRITARSGGTIAGNEGATMNSGCA